MVKKKTEKEITLEHLASSITNLSSLVENGFAAVAHDIAEIKGELQTVATIVESSAGSRGGGPSGESV